MLVVLSLKDRMILGTYIFLIKNIIMYLIIRTKKWIMKKNKPVLTELNWTFLSGLYLPLILIDILYIRN